MSSRQTKTAVLHIITKLELGGAQQVALYIVGNLDRERFAPYLVAGPGGLLNEEAERLPDVPFAITPHLVREIRPWSEFRAYRELRRKIREIRPRIVHTHSSKAGVLGRLAAAAEGVPIVLHTIHGFGIPAAPGTLLQRCLLAAERMAAKRTTHFVAVSRENIETGKRFGLFDDSKVTLIYAGVAIKAFREAPYRPELADELGIPRDAPVVGTISCFKAQKAPLSFIELAAKVCAEIPAARFLLVGDGELRPQIEAAVREHELQGKVILAGWRHDVPELLKLMRISVLTSLWEGLPMVIPQSLSAGVPVVVTRVGGSPEAVREGETGFVVEPGDIQSMAERVTAILKNEELAKRLSMAGPTSVADWDQDKMVRDHEILYNRLLEEQSG
jgi:glycosyltransferase involved in cell wall biosynthesis